MTREMCLKWLKWIKNMFIPDSEQDKAMDYAIKSIEVDLQYNLLFEDPDRLRDNIHAKWLPYETGGEGWHKCSNCKLADYYLTDYQGHKLKAIRKYCPNCGAQMDRKE